MDISLAHELQTRSNSMPFHVRIVRAPGQRGECGHSYRSASISSTIRAALLATPAYADRGSVTKASAEASGSRGPGLYMRQGDRRYMDEGYHHETR